MVDYAGLQPINHTPCFCLRQSSWANVDLLSNVFYYRIGSKKLLQIPEEYAYWMSLISGK